MNHSCDPNCYFKMRSIAVYDVYAFRDIRQGEELTHDYTATSVDMAADLAGLIEALGLEQPVVGGIRWGRT